MRVIAIDVGPEKGQLCQSSGAEIYIDVLTCKDIATEVKRATGCGGELILNCCIPV